MRGDQLDLDAIEARASAATAGPWRDVVLGSEGYAVTGPQGSSVGGHPRRVPRVARCGHESWDVDRANADFIAHAREDVPALLAEVRRLRVERDSAKAAIASLVRMLADDPRDAIPRLDITTALFTPAPATHPTTETGHRP